MTEKFACHVFVRGMCCGSLEPAVRVCRACAWRKGTPLERAKIGTFSCTIKNIVNHSSHVYFFCNLFTFHVSVRVRLHVHDVQNANFQVDVDVGVD